MGAGEFVKITKKIKEEVCGEEYKNKNKKNKKDFTRNRKVGFYETCMLVLESCKKGMRSAIKDFMKATGAEYQCYSNAAFCKARQKVKPEAFHEIMKMAADGFYEELQAKTFEGYRIFAIDGSDLNLPNTEETMEVFGSQPYQHCHQVQAILSMMYDVLNHIVLDVRIGKALGNERKLALEHLQEYDKYKGEKAIITADRGYPSEELIEALENQGAYYVIRANKNEFWKEIRDIKGTEDTCIERVCKNKKTLKVRVLTIKLSDEKDEILITNLFDENLGVDFFKEVYKLRWKIETNYNLIKNQMQLENFSCILPDCILQDIYAQMVLLNLAACLEADCDDEIAKINKEGDRKYPVVINRAVCVSELKNSVIELFWASPRKQTKIFNNIRKVMLKNLTVIRDGRFFPRDNPKHYSLKFPGNYKAI